MLYETFSNSLLVEGSEAHSLSEEGKHACRCSIGFINMSLAYLVCFYTLHFKT